MDDLTLDKAAEMPMPTADAHESEDPITLDNFLDRDYLSGQWSGLDNYKCPFCNFATVRGNTQVAEHIFDTHKERL